MPRRSRRRSPPRPRSRASSIRACARSRRRCETRSCCGRARSSSPGSTWPILQPLLRAVAPDLGMAAPVVRLRDSLAPLQLRLELPAAAATTAGCCARLRTIRRSCAGRRTSSPRSAKAVDGVVTAGRGGRHRAAPGDVGARVRRRPRGAPARGVRGARSRARRCQARAGGRPAAARAGSSATTCTHRSAATRSASRSCGRWPQRRSRWCGWGASGGRSTPRRSPAPGRSPRRCCTARACRR